MLSALLLLLPVAWVYMVTKRRSGYDESVVELFFFFQAEDGIRDYKVTGVQTCALPISKSQPRPLGFATARLSARLSDFKLVRERRHRVVPALLVSLRQSAVDSGLLNAQIGRASCRERV